MDQVIPIQRGPVGVLLVNLGTPDAPTRSAVFRYLRQFLADRRVIDLPWVRKVIMPLFVIPRRVGSSTEAYRRLWTEAGSPLKVYGERLAAGVQQRLGDGFVVALAMRYQHPSIASALDRLLAAQIRHLVVVPLFPQYAASTTASVQAEVMRLLQRRWYIPPLTMVDSFFAHPAFLSLFAKKGRNFPLHTYDHVLFSYHGLPERHLTRAPGGAHCLKDDCCTRIHAQNQFCYRAQCLATTRGIAHLLELPAGTYSTSFQSRLGRDPWLKPYTEDVIFHLARQGARKMLVFCPAFVADCLETTIEIGQEYAEIFVEAGGTRLDLVPSLNDDPEWIDAMAQLVRDWVPQPAAEAMPAKAP